MDELTSRFLNAWEQIESHLRRSCPEVVHAAFPRVVSLAARNSSAVRHYAADLLEIAQLRQAMMHSARYQGPTATPHPKLLERLEAIQAHLLSPPAVGDLFRATVATCQLDSPISLAANRMVRGAYSQLPVYSESSLEGLLTLDALGRWAAECMAKGNPVAPETNVGVVLRHAEEPANYEVLAPSDPVFDALEKFQDYHNRGKRLDAIVITASASKKHRPSGIITLFDLPVIHEAIH